MVMPFGPPNRVIVPPTHTGEFELAVAVGLGLTVTVPGHVFEQPFFVTVSFTV